MRHVRFHRFPVHLPAVRLHDVLDDVAFVLAIIADFSLFSQEFVIGFRIVLRIDH